jgi:iron complex transport system ATP-binding protein
MSVRIEKETLLVQSEKPMKTLSSSLLGGGFNKTRYILNHHVDKNFSHKSPGRYLQRVSAGLGINEKIVGMMTAADLTNLSVKTHEKQDLKVAAIVTGGVSNSAEAGEKKASHTHAGTINTILLVNKGLMDSAFVGAVLTATEAKTIALRELQVRSASNGNPATGTTTDAIAIATMNQRPKLKYAGTGTLLGELAGRAVRRATAEAIKKQEGWD